jgi:hypothetical protein
MFQYHWKGYIKKTATIWKQTILRNNLKQLKLYTKNTVESNKLTWKCNKIALQINASFSVYAQINICSQPIADTYFNMMCMNELLENSWNHTSEISKMGTSKYKLRCQWGGMLRVSCSASTPPSKSSGPKQQQLQHVSRPSPPNAVAAGEGGGVSTGSSRAGASHCCSRSSWAGSSPTHFGRDTSASSGTMSAPSRMKFWSAGAWRWHSWIDELMQERKKLLNGLFRRAGQGSMPARDSPAVLAMGLRPVSGEQAGRPTRTALRRGLIRGRGVALLAVRDLIRPSIYHWLGDWIGIRGEQIGCHGTNGALRWLPTASLAEISLFVESGKESYLNRPKARLHARRLQLRQLFVNEAERAVS